MVFGDGESLTPAYKKSDRQTLPECGMVWLSRFRSVLNVWQVSWTAVSNARFFVLLQDAIKNTNAGRLGFQTRILTPP